MRGFCARTMVMFIALVATGGAVPASAGPVPIPNPYVFTSADVGFIDGSDPAGRPGRIAEMDAYIGDKKPIIRLDLSWDRVQPCATCPPDWAALDAQVDVAYAQGVRVLLILDYSAPWANGGRNPNYFPTDDGAWANIVSQAVAHFGPKVQAYEVWNEPNISPFGNYGDNSVDVRAGRYWELVKIAYQQVHSGCPGCVVVAGGSAGGDSYTVNNRIYNDNEARDWLEWAYQHNMGGYFDAVAFHPYPDWGGGHIPSYAKIPCHDGTWYRYWSGFGPDDPECGGLAALRDVMVRYGDSAKKIWATEFGFPSVGSREPQAPEHVRDALEEGVRMWRSRPYTGPMFIYSFQDTEKGHEVCTNPNEGECHFGLRDNDGNPKEPMYSDVRAALIGDNWLASLSPGRSLFRGAAMRSNDGRFTLWMQADGNLVLYDGRNGTQKAIWVRGGLRAYRLSNQHDGNLVLYDQADRPLWASNTSGKGDSTLWLQEDGNLVLYAHYPAPAKPSWASNTVVQ
jgi:hypothetical protein